MIQNVRFFKTCRIVFLREDILRQANSILPTDTYTLQM